MYYPQQVSLDSGPTAVLEGSQYYSAASHRQLCEDAALGMACVSDQQVPPDSWGGSKSLVLAQGSVVLIHFDLWHRLAFCFPSPCALSIASFRATARKALPSTNRFMLKFQFVRSREPSCNEWPWHHDPQVELTQLLDTTHMMYPVWHAIWCWMLGLPPQLCGAHTEAAVPRCDAARRRMCLQTHECLGKCDSADDLEAEPQSVTSVYMLSSSLRGMEELFGYAVAPMQQSDSELGRLARLAVHGLALSALVHPDAQHLLERVAQACTSATQSAVRENACYLLGHVGGLDGKCLCVKELTEALRDPDHLVRAAAAEAIGFSAKACTPTLFEQILECAELELDGHVLQALCLCLAKMCTIRGFVAETHVERLAHLAQALPDRYARSFCLVALERSAVLFGCGKAALALIRVLAESRWCSLTTSESGY